MDGRLVDETSPYFHKVALPALRTLAANGVTFARTYTASPQCVPSRTSMLTSRYVHEINTWSNCQGIARSPATGKLDSNCVSEWSQAQCEAFAAEQNVNETFFDSLRSAGYRVQIIGRVDAGAGILDENPLATGDGFHGGPSLPIQSRAADIRRATQASPPSQVNDNTSRPYAGDIDVVGETVAWLQAHPPTPGRPLFLLVGLLDPHPPYYTNSTYLSAVNESAVDVPQQVPFNDTHPYDSYMSTSKAAYQSFPDDAVRAVRRSYWGAVAEADALVGDVLRAANATGHLNNTIVVFTSDHGELAMEHRQDLKNAMYEGAVRVPLIVAGFSTPQFAMPAGAVVTNLTSLLDVYPTLMDVAGASPPAVARGYSLAPYLGVHSSTPLRPGYIAAEYHSNMGNTGSFMLRQAQYKYITFGRNGAPFANYSDMLFDVAADPGELDNVAPQFPSITAMMLATLTTEMREALQTIDLRAKANDLLLYRAFFESIYNKTFLYNQFESAYSGFDAGDAAKVQAWSGSAPVRDSDGSAV